MYIQPNEPESRLSINEMIELTKQPFFKKSISQRERDLGKISYIGFKYSYHWNKNKKIVLYVNLYFKMQGQKHQEKDSKKGKRNVYTLVAKFPYTTRIKNMKRLYDIPIQIFSSDPSFKYFFAYALKRFDAVVDDDIQLKKWLGVSLTTAPNKTNPDLVIQLTKHFYKFFKFLANHKPKEYMTPRYLIPIDKKIDLGLKI